VASGNIVATASGDGLVSSQTFTLQVQQAPGVTLGASPASVQMQSLSTASLTVTATPVGGLAVEVSGPSSAYRGHSRGLEGLLGGFSSGSGTTGAGASISMVSGLPEGITATFSTPSVASNGSIVWTLTLTGSASAVAGSSTLDLIAKLTAVDTGVIYSASVNVPITITLTPPSDGTVSWMSNLETMSAESGSSAPTLTSSSEATAGTAATAVTASGDGLTASKQLGVQVAQPPGVQMTLGETTLSMAHTAAGGVGVTVTPLGGLSAAMTLKVSGVPSGVTAAFSKSRLVGPGSGSATLTFTGSTAAKAGTTTVTVTVSGTGNTALYSTSQMLSLVLK
jgi:hypothetical protein